MSTVSPRKSTAAKLMIEKGTASDFFWNYIDQMEPFYPQTFQGLHNTTNPPSKRGLNEATSVASENWFTDTIEEKYGTKGLSLKEELGIQPHILLSPQPNRKIILKARSRYIFLTDKEVPICNLCDERVPATLAHLLVKCKFPPFQAFNADIITLLEGLDNNLSNKWSKLSPHQKTNILLGADWKSPPGPKTKLIMLASSFIRRISDYPSVFAML
jgi:hypothetical protein